MLKCDVKLIEYKHNSVLKKMFLFLIYYCEVHSNNNH
jgi:hypothetical protein